jgi:hypothetical protein
VAPARGIGTGATTSSGKERLRKLSGGADAAVQNHGVQIAQHRGTAIRPLDAARAGDRAGAHRPGPWGYWLIDQVSGMVAVSP